MSHKELNIAAKEGRAVGVQALLEEGAELHHQKDNSWPALHWAAFFENINVMQILLESDASIYEKGFDERTVLHDAANSRVELLHLLLDAGAEIESKGRDGRTPLIIAGGNGRVGLVQALLLRGADLDAKDNEGRYASTWALLSGHDEAVLVFEAAQEEQEAEWLALEAAAREQEHKESSTNY